MNDTERLDDYQWLDDIFQEQWPELADVNGFANTKRLIKQRFQALLDEARVAELQNLVDGNWKEHGDIYYTALKRISTLTQKQEN